MPNLAIMGMSAPSKIYELLTAILTKYALPAISAPQSIIIKNVTTPDISI